MPGESDNNAAKERLRPQKHTSKQTKQFALIAILSLVFLVVLVWQPASKSEFETEAIPLAINTVSRKSSPAPAKPAPETNQDSPFVETKELPRMDISVMLNHDLFQKPPIAQEDSGAEVVATKNELPFAVGAVYGRAGSDEHAALINETIVRSGDQLHGNQVLTVSPSGVRIAQ